MDRRAAVASVGPGYTATTERGPPNLSVALQINRKHARPGADKLRR